MVQFRVHKLVDSRSVMTCKTYSKDPPFSLFFHPRGPLLDRAHPQPRDIPSSTRQRDRGLNANWHDFDGEIIPMWRIRLSLLIIVVGIPGCRLRGHGVVSLVVSVVVFL